MKHLLTLSNASHISRVLSTLPKIKNWLVAYSEVCEPLDPCVVRSSTTMIWLCKTNGPTSFTRMTFKNLCHFSDDKWLKIQVNWYVSKMNSTWQIFLSFTDNTKKIPYDDIALKFHEAYYLMKCFTSSGHSNPTSPCHMTHQVGDISCCGLVALTYIVSYQSLWGKIHFVWFYRYNQIRIFMVICKAGKDNADVQIAHHMERKMHRLHIIWRERCTDCTSYEDKEKIYWIMIINLYVFIYQGGIQLALVVLDLTKHENMFEFWNK